jgi:hypothetical protein
MRISLCRVKHYLSPTSPGRYLLEAIEEFSPLYTRCVQTRPEEDGDEEEIVIDLSAFEGSPRISSDQGMVDVMKTRCEVTKLPLSHTFLHNFLYLISNFAITFIFRIVVLLSSNTVRHFAMASKEWTGYLLDILGSEAPETMEYVLDFMPVLTRNPLPIRYLVMHFMTADALFHSLELCDRKDYLMWIVDLFSATKFFTALGTASSEMLNGILEFLEDPSTKARVGGAAAIRSSGEGGGEAESSEEENEEDFLERCASSLKASSSRPQSRSQSRAAGRDEMGDEERWGRDLMVEGWKNFETTREKFRNGKKNEITRGDTVYSVAIISLMKERASFFNTPYYLYYCNLNLD